VDGIASFKSFSVTAQNHAQLLWINMLGCFINATNILGQYLSNENFRIKILIRRNVLYEDKMFQIF
jgi:hypothetical protein